MSEVQFADLTAASNVKEGDEIQVEVLNPDEINPDEEEDNKESSSEQTKSNDENKTYVQLQVVYDNYALIGGDSDGGKSNNNYRVITAEQTGSNEEESGETVYVLNETGEPVSVSNEDGTQYVMVERGDQNNLVIMDCPDNKEQACQELEDDTAPSLLAQVIHDDIAPSVMRRHRTQLPPPHVLLASPNFRLYLYTCRQCSFKCNAIKEMSEHKKKNHSWKASRIWKPAGTRPPPTSLQCDKCPHKALTYTLIRKHMETYHGEDEDELPAESASGKSGASILDAESCTHCAYVTHDKRQLKKHIQRHKKLRK